MIRFLFSLKGRPNMKKRERTRKQKIIRRTFWITGGVLLSLVLSVAIQFGYNSLFLKPVGDVELTKGGDSALNTLLRDGRSAPDDFFSDPTTLSGSLAGALEEIDDRNDCSDFTAMALMRFYLENENRLPAANKEEIKKTMIGFTFWPSEDGGKPNGMCFWSENHQIMFASDEYLAGLTWPNETFADGQKGSVHLSFAKERIADWMEARFTYGFSEYYSNNYYPEDIGPMANFIQFASKEDEAMANRMKMIMDLLFYDVASQSYKYVSPDSGKTQYAFMSASGRMYLDNKASDDTGNRLRDYASYIFGINQSDYVDSTTKYFNSFRHLCEATDGEGHHIYELPEVLKNIYNDPSEEQIIKSSSGLNIDELKSEGLIGPNTKQIMMQFGMEAFSNPAVIDNSIAFMNKYHLFRNTMLNDFKTVNLWPLTLTRTLGSLSASLHPATDGKAIERGNIYTYQTPDYELSTNQGYHPGEFGDQQQISLATLGHDLSVFTMTPERKSDREAYWLGQGRMPYSVQDKNVNISLFKVPTKAGFMEPYAVSFTHTYFPVGLFDEVNLNYLHQGFVYGRKGNAFVMVRAQSDDPSATLSFKNDMSGVASLDLENDLKKIKTSVASLVSGSPDARYDLILEGGSKHCYVTELSSASKDLSFASFVNRTQTNSLSFDAAAMTADYSTAGVSLSATYDSVFSVNGLTQDLNYERFESPYVQGGKTTRKASTIALSFGGHSLSLDYEHNERSVA